MRKTLFTASVLAVALASPFAQAFQAGDVIVRAGAITVDPHEETSGVAVDRGGLAGTDLGGKASLDSDTQLGLNFAYMVTDHLGLELLAATPFTHGVSVSGTGELKHLPPTLSLVYYPMATTSAFQPYVGAGVNYTWFFDESVSSNFTDRGYDNFRVENSWGWAAQVGMDYMLTDQVMLNAQVRYIDIDTNAYIDHPGLGIRAKVDVEVDPMVYMVGLGYKF